MILKAASSNMPLVYLTNFSESQLSFPLWPAFMTHQMTLNAIRSKESHIGFTNVALRKFRFRVNGHFETNALNDPTPALNVMRSKLGFIFVTTIPYSKILVSFALWPVIIEISASLRQVHQLALKLP